MSQNPIITPLNTENKPEEPKGEEPKNSALTRLIVKNIPKTLDELSLKKLFEKFGEVTDCQIIFKGEINRQFAFIGFRDINSSEKAKLKMNNTFIKSSKVTVDFAVEKTPLPKPNPRNKSIPKQIIAETEKIGQQNSAQNLEVASFEIDEKRLYVTNLPYSVTNEDLAQVFSKIGKVESAKIIDTGLLILRTKTVRSGQSMNWTRRIFLEDQLDYLNAENQQIPQFQISTKKWRLKNRLLRN